MKKNNESLIYHVADALQIAIHPIGDGYKCDATRKTKIGPWEYELNLKVKSDVLTDDTASFWVKVIGDLWLYIVSDRTGKGLQMTPFSASAAKVSPSMLSTPCVQGVLSESLAKVRAGGGNVTYKYGKDGWVPINNKEAVK